MVQLTYWEDRTDTAEPEAPPRPADDVHTLRHGYNLADLDRLTRVALSRVRTDRADGQYRYAAAWSAIAEHLYSVDERPSWQDLAYTGQKAIGRLTRDEMRHHGKSTTTPGEVWPAYVRYWDSVIHYAPSPEFKVVENTALWQIWPQLTPNDRRVLLALAAHENHSRAANACDMTYMAFRAAISLARRRFLRLWHEHETPSRPWGVDRRSGRTTYRTARKNMLNRQPVADKPAYEPAHGKESTYTRFGCHCVACCAARIEALAARRRAAGIAQRRFVDAEARAEIVRLFEAGVPRSRIVAELGWSRSTVYNVIRERSVTPRSPTGGGGRLKSAHVAGSSPVEGTDAVITFPAEYHEHRGGHE